MVVVVTGLIQEMQGPLMVPPTLEAAAAARVLERQELAVPASLC